jgi:hypothetical protein
LARDGEDAIDVAVRRGPFPGNRPPVLELHASAESVAVGEEVTLTAEAYDPDGDALAFHWQGAAADPAPNAPTFTTAWSTPGRYHVALTVSDMKGKTITRTRLVRVGQPDTLAIAGTVRDAIGRPASGVRVHNGASGQNLRETVTDEDGRFVPVTCRSKPLQAFIL